MVDCRRCKVEIGEISRQSIPIKYTGKIDKSICDNSSCLYISHVCSVRVLSDGGDRSELMAVGVRSRRRDGDKSRQFGSFTQKLGLCVTDYVKMLQTGEVWLIRV